jgi:hypothetical protein
VEEFLAMGRVFDKALCDTISKPESLFFFFLLFAEASLSLLLVSHIGVLLRWGEA